uniref:Uncharacterized protein n=1 Tax=Ananas comosus var. bracteatus TaxID=296719 RepID=A0A6V7NTZ1_ANACO|nr:unnamed protein product [Ananas comosus var. bracteatus]
MTHRLAANGSHHTQQRYMSDSVTWRHPHRTYQHGFSLLWRSLHFSSLTQPLLGVLRAEGPVSPTRDRSPRALPDITHSGTGWDRSLPARDRLHQQPRSLQLMGPVSHLQRPVPESNLSPKMQIALFALADSIPMHFLGFVHPRLFQSLPTRPSVNSEQASLGTLRAEGPVSPTWDRSPRASARVTRSETGPSLRDRSPGDRFLPKRRFPRVGFSGLSQLLAFLAGIAFGDRSLPTRDRLPQESPQPQPMGPVPLCQGPVLEISFAPVQVLH